MSIVVNVLFNEKSYLVGDQRVSRKEGNAIVPLSETGHKVFRLSNNVSIGFTGSYELAMGVWERVTLWAKNNPVPAQSADIVARQLHRAFLESGDQFNKALCVVVSGVTSSGNMARYTFRIENGCAMDEQIVTPQAPVVYTLLGEDVANQLDFEGRLIASIRNSGNNPDSAIVSCLRDFVVSVSEITETVNSNVEVIIVP